MSAVARLALTCGCRVAVEFPERYDEDDPFTSTVLPCDDHKDVDRFTVKGNVVESFLWFRGPGAWRTVRNLVEDVS
jgi:hypothetical protein